MANPLEQKRLILNITRHLILGRDFTRLVRCKHLTTTSPRRHKCALHFRWSRHAVVGSLPKVSWELSAGILTVSCEIRGYQSVEDDEVDFLDCDITWLDSRNQHFV